MIKNKTLMNNKSLDVFLSVLLNMIIFSTNNKLMMYTKHLSLIFIIVCILNIFLIGKKNLIIKLNAYSILYIFFLILIGMSLFYAKNVVPIFEYSIYLILGIFIIFTKFSTEFYRYFLKIFNLLFWIFILSMYLEVLSPNAFYAICSFASFGDADMRALTSGGAIAGLAFEKAYAAFICNLGIGIIMAEFVLEKSIKSITELIFVMIALMMTGKRTLFIIPIMILFIYTILFSKNNKFIKLAIAGLAILILVFVVYMVVPGANLIIDRLIDNQGDFLSGRENFWNYAMEMFHRSPIFGAGFMSFNDYVYDQGFRYYGDKWNYQAHNVYVQLLGETGLIGFGIFVILIILLICESINLSKKKQNFWNVLLIYWTILFTVYSFTGNTIYYPCQFVILFICILFISNNRILGDIVYKNGKIIKFILYNKTRR